MKLSRLFIGVSLAAGSFLVIAAKPAPVLEIGVNPSGLSQQLATLERKLDARNRSQISMQQQLDDLQNEVNELRGVTELHTHQLSEVLERQRELYRELDRRVNDALKPKNSISDTIQAPETAVNDVSYSNDLTENESYDRAVNLVLKDKRYEQAISEFKSFNAKYPTSSYASNAHYWLGQLLFNKGELSDAASEFEIVVLKFKDSSKRSDSLLKLAAVAQKQKSKAKSMALYKQVIAEYPNSSAAQLAKARLENIQH